MGAVKLVDSSVAVPPAAAVAAGIAGVIRYVSQEASKNLTPTEAAAYHAAGLTVTAVYEDGTSDYEGGAATGEQHGQVARALLDAIGYPAARALIVAVDTDIPASSYALGLEYVTTTAAVAGRAAGVYGPDAFVRYCMASGVRYGMNAAGWSDGAKNAAQIQQGFPPYLVGGVECDPDLASAADYGQWPYAPTDPPPGLPCIAASRIGGRVGYAWFLFPDGAVGGREVSGAVVRSFGDVLGRHLSKPAVAIASTPGGGGYWIVAEDGGVFSFGDARFFGSAAGRPLNKPIVGVIATPTGAGYALVAADGGVFTFGDAKYEGSAASIDLHAPIVGAAGAPGGAGYWLVGSDGGVFSFDGARFHGAEVAVAGSPAAVGISPCGGGYVVAFSDGTAKAFGTAQFGDYPSLPPPRRLGLRRFIGVAGEASGAYTLFGSDATQYRFG